MSRDAKYDVALNDLFIGECGHVLTSHVLRLPVVGYWGFHSADMVCTISFFDQCHLQGDTSSRLKPPVYPAVYLDFGCFAILPGQQVATTAAQLLPELSQREVFTDQMCHPVVYVAIWSNIT